MYERGLISLPRENARARVPSCTFDGVMFAFWHRRTFAFFRASSWPRCKIRSELFMSSVRTLAVLVFLFRFIMPLATLIENSNTSNVFCSFTSGPRKYNRFGEIPPPCAENFKSSSTYLSVHFQPSKEKLSVYII